MLNTSWQSNEKQGETSRDAQQQIQSLSRARKDTM